MPIVNKDKTVEEEYKRLLVEHRQLIQKELAGRAICIHCNKENSVHLPDDRCSCAATSRKFQNIERPKLLAIDRAICMLEELLV